MTAIFSDLSENSRCGTLILADGLSKPAQLYCNIVAACKRGTDFHHEWKLGVTVEEIQIYINKNVN